MSTELITRNHDSQVMPGGELAVADVKRQVQKIQELMRDLMEEGQHFGVIPGTDKPTLLKPGAEKLSFTFRLVPEYEVIEREFQGGHREYRVSCRLIHQGTGTLAGQGVGICSTLESKYRYRNVADYEITGEKIPEDAKERKAEYRKQGFGMKKVDEQWCWVRYKDSARVENPDIADVYNTVLKMAKKRAFVDATITACAASDIFIQDAEDFVDEEPAGNGKKPAVSSAAPANGGEAKQRAVEARDSYDFTKAPGAEAKLKFVNDQIAKIKTDKDAEELITIIRNWKLPKSKKIKAEEPAQGEFGTFQGGGHE